MDTIGFTPEQGSCPDRNERCTKLAMKAIKHFLNGGDYKQLDPRFGGFAWNFSEPSHYDHITTAIKASGNEVERADTARRPGTDEVPTFGVRRVISE